MTESRPISERVRRLLARANDEAARLQHEYVGTEHILLGLALDREGAAVAVLQNLGVDLDDLRAQVDRMVKRGPSEVASLTHRPYTNRAKRVLELAGKASEALGHQYVGTEHVLLGLLEEARGIGGQLLVASGVTIDRARTETLRLLGTPPS